MSDAVKIANKAPLIVEGLLTEMFAGDHPDNSIVLGVLGDQEIQIQLIVTRDKSAFIDE